MGGAPALAAGAAEGAVNWRDETPLSVLFAAYLMVLVLFFALAAL